MGIVKNLNLVKPKKSRVAFRRFYGIDATYDGSVGGYNKANLAYNFSCKDGALKNSLGLKLLYDKYVYDGFYHIAAMYFYNRKDYEYDKKDDRIVICTDDGLVYDCSASGGIFQLIDGLFFNQTPIGVCYNYNGKDVLLLSSEEDGLVIYDGENWQKVEGAPPITSMCIHSERLFITSGGVDGALWFSDDFDPTNWNVSLSEAGFIDLGEDRGEMLCVLPLGGHVYVFSSFGVSRVTAYGDQTEFSVSHLLTSCGKILKNTIMSCGDCIMFFATDGLYRFDGYNAERVSDPWFGKVSTDAYFVKGRYYNGTAYYLLQFLHGDSYDNGVLTIKPNGSDGEIIFIGLISEICLLKTDEEYSLLAYERGAKSICEFAKDQGFCGEAVPMEWESKESDFGVSAKRKRLTEITFNSNLTVKLTVVADGKAYPFTVEPKNGKCVVKPNVYGNAFSFKIMVMGVKAEISGFELEFSYYR